MAKALGRLSENRAENKRKNLYAAVYFLLRARQVSIFFDNLLLEGILMGQGLQVLLPMKVGALLVWAGGAANARWPNSIFRSPRR